MAMSALINFMTFIVHYLGYNLEKFPNIRDGGNHGCPVHDAFLGGWPKFYSTQRLVPYPSRGFIVRRVGEREWLRDDDVVGIVLADPEPDVFVSQPDGESAVFQRHAEGPNLLAAPVANFLELEGRVLGIRLQQLELLVRTFAGSPS